MVSSLEETVSLLENMDPRSEVFCEESFCFIHDDHATTNFMLYSGNHFLFPVGDVQAVENISMFFCEESMP